MTCLFAKKMPSSDSAVYTTKTRASQDSIQAMIDYLKREDNEDSTVSATTSQATTSQPPDDVHKWMPWSKRVRYFLYRPGVYGPTMGLMIAMLIGGIYLLTQIDIGIQVLIGLGAGAVLSVAVESFDNNIPIFTNANGYGFLIMVLAVFGLLLAREGAISLTTVLVALGMMAVGYLVSLVRYNSLSRQAFGEK